MARRRWPRYVPVAERRAKAARETGKLGKKGLKVEPVEIQGRTIATTFWGKAWCGHLEQFSDYANRLPRGRSYVRNGSVCHLAISKGTVQAIVSGSKLYHVEISISSLPAASWASVRQRCAGQIGSMLELLQGRLSTSVMEVVTHRDEGLFPQPDEIDLSCDCPDWAVMCKHVAATLYGIGARLDQQPELLFLLRDVDHQELISAGLDMGAAAAGKGKRRRLAGQGLADVFGIDIAGPAEADGGEQVPGRITNQPEAVNASNQEAFKPSSAAISGLRNRLQMSRSQFAGLVGVSAQTIANWENAEGPLNPRRSPLESLRRAAGLSKAAAWEILRESPAAPGNNRQRPRR